MLKFPNIAWDKSGPLREEITNDLVGEGRELNVVELTERLEAASKVYPGRLIRI